MLLQPRDLLIFEAIQRHGPLPSHYLYAFTKHIAKDAFGFSKRLLALTREGYLARPPQLNHPRVFTDFKVYLLARKAYEALKAAGTLHRFATPVSGDYRHQFMTACVTANIELGAVAAGYVYVSQEDILAKETCPEATRNTPKPLALPVAISHSFTRASGTSFVQTSNHRAEPDQLFGIAYGSGYRFFALEADRGTEPLTRQNLEDNSTLRKLLSYKQILDQRAYKGRWGIPNLYPMFVTTAEARVSNMLALAYKLFPAGCPFLLFGKVPGFGDYLHTPSLLPDLFDGEYRRIGSTFSIRD